MIVTPGCLQNIGARASQQDAFIFSNIDDRRFVNHAGVLAVVADGMGGMANGGEASHMAVKVFHNSYMTKTGGETIPQALDRALMDANKAVYQYAKSTGQAENTGTTLVAAVVHEHNLYWISVGDSRLYLCRRGKLTQVNEEHLYAHELDRDAAAGKITQDEALNNPERRALTSYLGQPKPEEIDRNAHPFPLEGGDRLLLCSDGLYAALSDQEMAQPLAGKPQNAADALIAQVLNMKRPGQDNLTVAILGCEEEPVGGREGGVPSEDELPARSKARVVVATFLSVVAAFGIGVGGLWWHQTQQTEAPGAPFLEWLSAKWQPDEQKKSDSPKPPTALSGLVVPQHGSIVGATPPAAPAPVSGVEAEYSSGVVSAGSAQHSGVAETQAPAPAPAALGGKKPGAGITPAAANALQVTKDKGSKEPAVKKKGDTAPLQNASSPRNAAANRGRAPTASAPPNPATPANPTGRPREKAKTGEESASKMAPTLTQPDTLAGDGSAGENYRVPS